MSEHSEKSRLKVCCTCNFWSYRHKGFCHRFEQGAGKFWMCEDWRAAAAEAKKSLPESLENTQVGAVMG